MPISPTEAKAKSIKENAELKARAIKELTKLFDEKLHKTRRFFLSKSGAFYHSMYYELIGVPGVLDDIIEIYGKVGWDVIFDERSQSIEIIFDEA